MNDKYIVKQNNLHPLNNLIEKKKSMGQEYLIKLDEFCSDYKVREQEIFSNSKIEFRYWCYRYLNLISNIKLKEITLNNRLEAVLIEYRQFPHLEFLIRNTINKLSGEWSHTVVCGNLNYDFIVEMCKKISSNIRIIKTNYDNLNQSTYSKLFASKEFWNLFVGEKILIYQEDSCIFKSNINDFLEWDYIGAPWPSNQNDNPLGVGNGGFSLRTKELMLKIIDTISLTDTQFNSSTLEYMKSSGMIVGPEDVYFSLNMIKYNIGKVANRDSASKFSTELINNLESLGGHNFWLSDNNWKLRLYNNLFTICAVSSPYGLRIGGGEIYLLNWCKYFIKNKNALIYLFVNSDYETKKKTITQVLGEEYFEYFVFFPCAELFNFNKKVDYHFDMYNEKIPYIKGLGKNNIFHCQFPFDTDKNGNPSNLSFYNKVIVNSEFTKKYYCKFIGDNYSHLDVNVVYPVSFDKILLSNTYDKEENTFVMIGRITDYAYAENNKNFDIALKYFELINNFNSNFTIYIIGTLFSDLVYKKLLQFRIKNLIIKINASEEEKIQILKKAKYIINMVGINRDLETECFAYEHFGMSILEGINYGCIPLSVNGGFPSYYIDKELLFNNENEFYDIIHEIIIGKKTHSYNKNKYLELLKKSTYEYFELSINLLLK
jgi:hypothetical protein